MYDVTLARRQFLRRGSLLAAGSLAIPGWAQWLGEKMEALQPKKHVVLNAPAIKTGLSPIPGQPGKFFDHERQQIVTIGDWTEDVKFSEVLLPEHTSRISVELTRWEVADQGINAAVGFSYAAMFNFALAGKDP